MKLIVGQTLYGAGLKTKPISFGSDLITGMKLLKPTIKRITNKYIVLKFSGNEQRISKDAIGRHLFMTEEEAINFIIKEHKRRIKQKDDATRSQHMDSEHLHYIKKDLKKWEKFLLSELSEVKDGM